MKKEKIILIMMLFSFVLTYGQTKSTKTKKRAIEYIDIIAKKNHINFVAKTKKELKDTVYYWYKEDLNLLKKKYPNKSKRYNNVVLNIHFKNIINAYATSTKDLSFSNYFMDANTTSKTLTIGKSFRLDNLSDSNRDEIKTLRPVQKLGQLFTIYGKSSFNNNFSNLSSFDKTANEYNFNSGIGIGAKYTRIYNGKITPQNKTEIEKVRDSLIAKSIQSSIDTYIKGAYLNEIKLLSIKNDTLNKDHTFKPDGTSNNDATINTANLIKFNKAKKELIQKKYFEFYKSIADKELVFNKTEKYIKHSSVRWVSVEGYLPLTFNKVLVSTDTISVINPPIKFNNWSLGGTYNYLQSYSNLLLNKEASFKVTVGLSLFNTNNFIANGTSATVFQNIIKENPKQNVNGSSQSVYIGDYKEDEVVSLKLAVSSLFLNNSIGLSAAYEKVFGDTALESRNWKLGIPFSLKDKEGEPTYNFELQWRELNTTHYVGISVGYNFGKFVK
jgi:hypothetical protein